MSRTTAGNDIRKNRHSHKICCTTYKKNCIYQKKAVPL